jgi:hypothetical protein
MRVRVNRRHKAGKKSEAYQCPMCKQWHITSQKSINQRSDRL